MRKPFFKKQKKAWYVHHQGKQVHLGKDKAEAFKKWHRLVAGEEPMQPSVKVADLLGLFLDWSEEQQAEATYQQYQYFLTRFAKHIGPLKLQALKPFHLSRWVEKEFKGRSPTTQHHAVRRVKRVFNWALDQGLIASNPLRRVKAPTPRSRDCYIHPEQWDSLLSKIDAEDPFLDLLLILRETGCRPLEAREVEARHFDRDLRAWCFPVEESKGKKHARTVPLNSTALAITQRLVLKYPAGPIFRNLDGQPWTKDAVVLRFQRLTKKLSFSASAYAIRHTFITDALINGVDPVTLSKIVGHRDLSMIQRVYSKLEMRNDHMQRAIEQATRSVKPQQRKQA